MTGLLATRPSRAGNLVVQLRLRPDEALAEIRQVGAAGARQGCLRAALTESAEALEVRPQQRGEVRS